MITADVAAATVASLSRMHPARLAKLVEQFGSPLPIYAAVTRGDERLPEDLAAQWQSELPALVTRVTAQLSRRNTHVLLADDPAFPIVDEVPDRPSFLLAEGEHLAAFQRPRVAIVGTRAATPPGLADAHALGAYLAEAGITVVSGLAIGIDGASHEGAIAARGTVVGVLATGLDVVYPRRHATLFERVRAAGVIVSESPFGTRPERYRFPIRNRIIAALADVVVVVEATLKGGARITAERALEYGRPVLAMPGSRRNAAAEGCNALLADGAHPLLDPSDVLIALGLTPGARRGWDVTARAAPSKAAAAILAACAGEPATTDQVVHRTGMARPDVIREIAELERGDRVRRARGFVWPL